MRLTDAQADAIRAAAATRLVDLPERFERRLEHL